MEMFGFGWQVEPAFTRISRVGPDQNEAKGDRNPAWLDNDQIVE